MTRVIQGRHKKRGKLYSWLLPEGMEAAPGDWMLVESRDRLAAVQVKKVAACQGKLPEKSAVKKVESLEEWRQFRDYPRNGEPPRHSFWGERTQWESQGLDMEPYWKAGFCVRQLRELRLGLELGLKVEKYADPAIPENRMRKLRRADMAALAEAVGLMPKGLSKRQRNEILYGLEQGVEVREYNDPSLDWRWMRDLRKCLAQGVPLERLKGLSRRQVNEYRISWEERQQEQGKEELEL